MTFIITMAKSYCSKREVPHIFLNFMTFMGLLQLKAILICFLSKTANRFSGLCRFTLSVFKMKQNHESLPFSYGITVQKKLKQNNNQMYLGVKTLRRVAISWQTNLGLNTFFFDKKGGNTFSKKAIAKFSCNFEMSLQKLLQCEWYDKLWQDLENLLLLSFDFFSKQ